MMAASEVTQEILHSVPLIDGRTLSYAIYGNNDITAPTIFYFYSYPDSHKGALIFDEVARKRGIRIIVPDRPGIGHSTFQARRKITDWPDDVLRLADSPNVRAERFAVLATGGGAPYALACCAKIPRSRLKAAGIVAGVYPSSLGISNYPFATQVYRWVAPWIPYLIEQSIESSYGVAARDTDHPERFEELLEKRRMVRSAQEPSASGQKTSEIRSIMIAGMRAAFDGDGAKTMAQDIRLAMSDWGFKLEDVNVEKGRLVIWHRTGDPSKPLEVAEKAHELLRGSELRVQFTNADIGDASVIERIGEILDTLSERIEW
ncbi:Alpha/Beta hydrolase protein [Hypoxylon sp. FL1857]|nr:Alpha/Beta hydrolase protein [Hypoxylon sp. FL1857]